MPANFMVSTQELSRFGFSSLILLCDKDFVDRSEFHISSMCCERRVNK
jgi:hypothetical protein